VEVAVDDVGTKLVE